MVSGRISKKKGSCASNAVHFHDDQCTSDTETVTQGHTAGTPTERYAGSIPLNEAARLCFGYSFVDDACPQRTAGGSAPIPTRSMPITPQHQPFPFPERFVGIPPLLDARPATTLLERDSVCRLTDRLDEQNASGAATLLHRARGSVDDPVRGPWVTSACSG